MEDDSRLTAWCEAMREFTTAPAETIDKKRWKEIVPDLFSPRKGGKHAKGKATKRKRRHRKGK